MKPPPVQNPLRTPSSALRALVPWIAAFAFGTGLDQFTKHWAELHLQHAGIVTLIPDVLDLRYARNPGAFFSLGAELPDGLRRVLLSAASALVICVIIALYRRAPELSRSARFGLPLLAGGATGNLIDRLRSGAVVDFVHLHAGAALHWATFNLADVAITLGLCLLGLDLLRPRTEPQAQRRSSPALDGGR